MQPADPKRRPDGKFGPGNSANPGGRPKGLHRVVELARAQTEESIEALVHVRDDPETSDSARVAAATALLDRGWGKPTQPIDLDPENRPMAELSDAELLEVVEAARKDKTV